MPLLGQMGILAMTLAGGYLFEGIHNAMMEVASFKLEAGMTERLHKKTAGLSAEFYEDSENLDSLEKAGKGVEQGAFLLNICFSIVAYYIPYFLFMGIYMAALKPSFIVSIFCVFFPVWLSQIYRSRMYNREQDESVVLERKYKHYEDCIKDRRYFKETRMMGAFSFFYKLYLANVMKYDKAKWKAVKKSGKAELMAKAITLTGYLLIVALFVQGVSTGEISVGAFGALFTSISGMFHTMEELICGHVTNVSENLVCVKNYVKFLERAEQDGTLEPEKEECGMTIEAENLVYCYPKDSRKVIQNVSFRIKAGETIALVGDNGAGKNTLVKLICGQYLPTSGNLRIGNVESRNIKRESLAERISVVSQTYQKYAMQLGENVHIGKSRCEKSEVYIKNLLTQAGMNLDKFPKGTETMLVREYGGIDLSGGEWQKTAIARGGYKDCDLIVLDEPTAAIDPLEEERLYRKFEQLGKGRTSIIVTHRLGVAGLADRIFVMENGKIAESGSHLQLMEKKGKYYEMYKAQKEMFYREENAEK